MNKNKCRIIFLRLISDKNTFNKILFLLIALMMFIGIASLNVSYIYSIDKGIPHYHTDKGLKVMDYDRDGKDELVINNDSNVYFYEFQNEYQFVLQDSICRNNAIWTAGMGDLDFDGLYDLVLIVDEDSIERIRILEQIDSFSFFTNEVALIETIFKGFISVGITNELKNDFKDRLYIAGFNLNYAIDGRGWTYFYTTGDNTFEYYPIMEESSSCYGMEFCNLDNDSFTDAVIMIGQKNAIYESTSIDDISFKTNNFWFDNYGIYTGDSKVLPDIDMDGKKEFIQWSQNASGSYHGFSIREDTNGNGTYDTIWLNEYEDIISYTNDFDFGDIDGDDRMDLAICGGGRIEIWKSTSDNQFELIWKWTDPSDVYVYNFISCHDFNKNGFSEIVFCESAESTREEITRVFEFDTFGFPEAHEIVNAEAYDGDIVSAGIDYDDFIKIEFDGLTREPKINKYNIDSVLKLSDGHSYLAYDKFLDTCRWETENMRSVLYIELTQILGQPTVQVGDTIYPDGITICSFEYSDLATSQPVVLTGSFGPEGVENIEQWVKDDQPRLKMTSSFIVWKTEGAATISIYDLSGREINRDEAKIKGEYYTDITNLKNGIFFVVLKTAEKRIIKKMVRVK